MENTVKALYEKAEEKIRKADFTTGFYDLDIFCKYLTGGDVLTIGGRPAMGKTNFAVSLVNHLIEKNKSVLYFSLAQSGMQFVYRLVAENMGAPLHTILGNRIEKSEIDKAIDYYENKKLYIDDKCVFTVDDIELSIKTIKQEIAFIDYIQLVEQPKAPNVTEAINLAIKEIKRIAVENDVIIVLVSQLSRAVESRYDRRPMLSDLRNGSLLEEVSDTILFVYRDSYYSTVSDMDQDLMRNEIIVAKNSMGPTGTVCLNFKNGFFRNPKYAEEF